MTKKLTKIDRLNMLSRRSFMQSSVVTTTGLAAWQITSPFTFGQEKSNTLVSTSPQPQVVIYQDKAHFDYTGLLEPYVPPKSLASSTRRYVEGLDTQTFRSRHWFI